MTTLQLRLRNASSVTILDLPTSAVIVTDLFVSSSRATMPTLVSVERIVEQIQFAGFELAHEEEVQKIAELINPLYLVQPKENWRDGFLELVVGQIVAKQRPQIREVQSVRTSVLASVTEITECERRNDLPKIRASQDNAVESVTNSIRRNPHWWERDIPKFLAKTAVPVLFNSILGIPLSVVIKFGLAQLGVPTSLF